MLWLTEEQLDSFGDNGFICHVDSLQYTINSLLDLVEFGVIYILVYSTFAAG